MSTPYASAAPYYARYRPPYPAELYALLADRFALDGSQTVLDLGAGPGTLGLPLARLAEHVYAVDPEPAMLAEGCGLAEEQGSRNISWLRGDAAGIGRLCLPRIDLCVIGGAFHRMDRVRVPADLDAVLAPRGGIAVVTSMASAWPSVVDEVRTRFLGPGDGAAGGTAHGTAGMEELRDVEDHLAKSAFSRVGTTTWERSAHCTVDQVIGLQFSRACSSPALFGDRKDAFESELRHALMERHPDGACTRTVTVAATIATRPRR
ncbi:class I SAM-dependent methyltransferase [Streptomyces xanthophaeus]|uniref:class I SAM-dependent methyltransferase n=1 Tax=Streptomyces xanthophaeus TaxID=67385 RepID=UPI0026470243|nr:class I SAM-dependent methyltransferase [Streptomyces xanthophaeus]WKD36465.1 class I SAM-dependent methyltransferase [Streptomyces xanthophaeus]